MSLVHLDPGKQAPEVVNAVVEIPTGSRIKYEVDHHTGLVHVDRVRKTVESDGWGGKDEAHAFIRKAIEAFNRKKR